MHWSLYGVPEQLENEATQECYWELQKFLLLALKANPNVLECLYSPIVEKITPLGQELLQLRESFLSKLVFQTYSGYVASQFKKMQADIRNHGTVKWKHVMHLIRLLMSGITVLKERQVMVEVGEHRERLLAIKRGEVPFSKGQISGGRSSSANLKVHSKEPSCLSGPITNASTSFSFEREDMAVHGESTT